MKLKSIFVLFWLVFFAVTSDAVKLNSNGIGEVLIVPYYTAQAGHNTLLSITNVSSTETKAVKLRLRESQNGKSVQSLNLYLQPNDVWTGSIEQHGDEAKIITSDKSCTVPKVPVSGLVFVMPSASSDDVGRTREGFVEILEMGVVEGVEYLSAVIPKPNTEGECDVHSGYWDEGGKWTINPSDGMIGTSGELIAEANIINVAAGVEYSQTLTILEDFNNSNEPMHTAPSSHQPSLDSAIPNETRMPDDVWTSPEDAVSGLLMSQYLLNSFTLNANVGAMTEWILTFPTKHFYTDSESVEQPFTSAFGENGACESIAFSYWNREGLGSEDILETTPPLGVNSVDLCYVVNTVDFIGVKPASSAVFQAEKSVGYLNLFGGGGSNYPNGWLKMKLFKTHPDAQEPLQASDYLDHIIESGSGIIYPGLPVTGFAVSRLENAKVGVGAAYAADMPHRLIRAVGISQVDPACVASGVCTYFDLPVDVSDNYDEHIEPGQRHVYHFTSPAFDANSDKPNYIVMFTVIDHGAIATVKLGLSKVKGRTEPQGEEMTECFSDDRTQLSLTAGSDDTYAECLIEYDTDYYFTIENVEKEQAGDYRFQFKKPAYY